MRRAIALVVALASVAGISWAAAEKPAKPPASSGPKERLVLVKVEERDKTVAYRVMSPEEFKALLSEIADEGRLYARAIRMAEDEWKKDEQLGKKAFPASGIGKRSAQTMGAPFTDRQKAEAKLSSYEDQQADMERKKAEAEKERNKNKPKDAIAREKQRDAERENLQSQARTFYEAKLTELKNAPKAPVPAPAPVPKAQGKDAGGAGEAKAL